MTDQAPTTPDTVVVPVEPTPKMLAATWDHEIDKSGGIESQNTRNARIYRAMLAARPAATPGGEREALTEDIETLRDIARVEFYAGSDRYGEAIKRILAALSRPAPVAGEAVAWRWRWLYEGSDLSEWIAGIVKPQEGDPSICELRDLQPLYATPQPAAARGGEVTAEMIEAFRDWYALDRGRPIMKGKARKIVGRILAASALSAKGGS